MGQERFGYFRLGRLPDFSKVTRRQGETLSSRYRSNGYTHKKTTRKTEPKKRHFPFLKRSAVFPK